MSSGNRNFICTVVFIDIAGFSKKSVADQLRVKEQLNQLLARSLQDIPAKDRIILDTGDGAAVSFLGDPEDGLYLGLALRDALTAGDSTLQLRTGINLGPVRLVKDINNQPNIIGDGINVAQRVMDFAAVNQVLASRSYYEIIAALSAEHARLFSFEGSRTDKHVREHEIYALGKAPAPPRAPKQKAAHAAAFEQLASTASIAGSGIMRRPLLATALAVTLILATAIGLRLALRAPDAEAPAAGEHLAADTPAARVPEPPPEAAAPPPAPVKPKPLATPRPARKPAAETAPAERTERLATGTVRLNILPWGEVYVDDRKFGVAPPLRDIALRPGSHRIEVRNPGFASYVQVVDVTAGEEIRIRHRFR
jgi:class 3 adenylate cyclase